MLAKMKKVSVLKVLPKIRTIFLAVSLVFFRMDKVVLKSIVHAKSDTRPMHGGQFDTMTNAFDETSISFSSFLELYKNANSVLPQFYKSRNEVSYDMNETYATLPKQILHEWGRKKEPINL
jgi:hypothetical protein